LVEEQARAQIEQLENEEGAKKWKGSQAAQETLAKTSVRSSCVAGERITGKRFSISAGARSSAKKSKKISATVKNQESTAATVTQVKDINTPISPTRLKKQKPTLTD
jgi:hypothetical protein